MTGREETEAKIESKINFRLSHCPDYMTNFYYSMGDLAPGTKYDYLIHADAFIQYAAKNFGINTSTPDDFVRVKVSDIERYVASLRGISDSGKRIRTYGVKKFFEYLEKDEYIENNPFNKIKVVRDRKQYEVVTLTHEEIQMIMYNIDHPMGTPKTQKYRYRMRHCFKAFVMLALTTGLRQGSLTEINIGDIDYKNKRVKVVQKGRTYHTVYFSDEVAEALKLWEIDRERLLRQANKKSDAFFLSVRLRRMSKSSLDELLPWITTGINKKITPHKFRATCCTEIVKNTGDIALAGHVLGHKSIQNTMRYVKFDKTDEDRAVQATQGLINFG